MRIRKYEEHAAKAWSMFGPFLPEHREKYLETPPHHGEPLLAIGMR